MNGKQRQEWLDTNKGKANWEKAFKKHIVLSLAEMETELMRLIDSDPVEFESLLSTYEKINLIYT